MEGFDTMSSVFIQSHFCCFYHYCQFKHVVRTFSYFMHVAGIFKYKVLIVTYLR